MARKHGERTDMPGFSRGRPQTTSTRLYAGGELQGSPVWQALAGHKRRIPLAVVPLNSQRHYPFHCAVCMAWPLLTWSIQAHLCGRKINIYAPNIGAPQYVRQVLTSMKGEINNNTIIVGDFNTPLTPMDRTKQKINKETQTLNDTIDQLDLIDIYRTFHPKTMNFTFF